MGEWMPMDSAPKDGTPVWAYLFQTGIRLVFWESAEACAERRGGEPEDFDAGWVECFNEDNDWKPKWWLPYDAIPQTPDMKP